MDMDNRPQLIIVDKFSRYLYIKRAERTTFLLYIKLFACLSLDNEKKTVLKHK